MTTDLICPKCQGTMRTYERSGITVDQCADCRGIFLDRGELEHLVDAEQSWQRREPSRRERERDREIPFPRTFGDDDDDDDRWRGGGDRKRRKRSFFDDLFD
ncbi:MAG TPA: zf-TFIIB domain-containing protein [Actinomycetes bacterium]